MILLALIAAALAADLTFEDALRAAADAPAGRIAVAEAAAVRAQIRGAASWQNPTVSVEDAPAERDVSVSLPIGLAPLARAAATPPAIDAIDVRARAARAAVGAAAGAAWLDARRAADHAAAAAQIEALAGRLAVAAEKQVAAGEWSPLAGVLARADAARALDRALGWEQEAQRARLALGVLVGGPVDALAAWPEVPPPPTPAPQALPAVLAADLDARAALANRLAARLALIPPVTVSAGWREGHDAGPVYGASVTIPLFSPGASGARAASARADVAVAEADRAALDAAATLAAVRAEIAVAERVAEAWRIDELSGALDATARLYDAGELPLGEYLAQRDLAVAATQSAIDARWRLARARLAGWELAGELPTELP